MLQQIVCTFIEDVICKGLDSFAGDVSNGVFSILLSMTHCPIVALAYRFCHILILEFNLFHCGQIPSDVVEAVLKEHGGNLHSATEALLEASGEDPAQPVGQPPLSCFQSENEMKIKLSLVL